MSVYLESPVLALCEDRNQYPKSNKKSGSPEGWFKQENLDCYNLHSISFDFFVNWRASPVRITRHAWIKVVLNVEPNEVVDNNGVVDSDFLMVLLESHFEKEILYKWYDFCFFNDLKLEFIFINEKSSRVVLEDNVIFSRVYEEGGVLKLKAKIISVSELKVKIKYGTGGDLTVGKKGLIYSTSSLECFLSKSDAAYPGDADLILFDKNTLETFAVLEFKKHTKKTPIEEQKLNNYYPYPDRVKYERLFLLNSYLKGRSSLVVLYYPTLNLINSKVEIVGEMQKKLYTKKSILITLPLSIENAHTYVEEFIKYLRGVKFNEKQA